MILANLALAIPFRVIFGMLIDRIGPRLVFSAVLIYAAIPCMAFALAQDFNQLVWSRLALGVVGAGFVVGIRMVSEWFPPREIGLAEGIYGGWGNFGSAVAALTLPLVATIASFLVGGQSSWRYAIALTGIISAAYGVFYFFNVQDSPPGQEFESAEHPGAIEVTTQKAFWVMTLTNLPIYVGLGVIAWRLSVVDVLNVTTVVIVYGVLFGLYLFQTYWNWRVNRELMAGFFVMAAEGAVYAMVPLIKKQITGQIAGNVGAYGNVGGTAYLILYSLLPQGEAGNRIFFSTIRITGLIMFFLLMFFLKEPKSSHEDEATEVELQPVPTRENIRENS